MTVCQWRASIFENRISALYNHLEGTVSPPLWKRKWGNRGSDSKAMCQGLGCVWLWNWCWSSGHTDAWQGADPVKGELGDAGSWFGLEAVGLGVPTLYFSIVAPTAFFVFLSKSQISVFIKMAWSRKETDMFSLHQLRSTWVLNASTK